MVLFDFLFAMDTDGDGMVSKEEMRVWLRNIRIPHHSDEEMGSCSDEMWTSEQNPQAANEPCGSGTSEGNLIFRSVCKRTALTLTPSACRLTADTQRTV